MSLEAPFSSPDLSRMIVGVRIFHKGTNFDDEVCAMLKNKVGQVNEFQRSVSEAHGEKAPHIVIITNDNVTVRALGDWIKMGTPVHVVAGESARRRIELAMRLVGKTDKTEPNFSPADMMDALTGSNRFRNFSFANMMNSVREVGENMKGHFDIRAYISADVISKEGVPQQLARLQKVWSAWQDMRPNRLSQLGSYLPGVHERTGPTIDNAISGKEGLTLATLWQSFPDTAFSLVPQDMHFAGYTDNGIAGTIVIDGKQEPIGGNEGFLYSLWEMIYHGKDSALLIKPHIEGERTGELNAIPAKYARRKNMYNLFARRTIERAIQRGKIDYPKKAYLTEDELERIVQDLIDRHLFFVGMNEHGEPDIILTARQQERGIETSVLSAVPVEKRG